ncbi:MAG: hypothetical protein U9Q78_02430 [Chloroflexota bacterium]|nr:hypothetical protein [Chloroflexota bacterium]
MRELSGDEYVGAEVLKYLGFWPEMPNDFAEDIMEGRRTFFSDREVDL